MTDNGDPINSEHLSTGSPFRGLGKDGPLEFVGHNHPGKHKSYPTHLRHSFWVAERAGLDRSSFSPVKLTRALQVQLREHEDDNDRTFRFTASTETPVDVFGMPEVLRADGVDLSRYERNPVVLNTHNHGDVSQIVGKAAMRVEGAEVVGRVTFTEATQAGREALALARDGMLSAVSVGFEPLKARELRRGETDGEGARQVTGPARVVTEWSLLELSVVPVPADPNAVKRAYQEIHTMSKRASDDDEDEKDDEDEDKKRAEDDEDNDGADVVVEVDADDDDEKKRAEDDDEEDDDEDERTADAVVARQVEDRRRLIMSFCPSDLRSFAEGLLLEDPQITPAKARAALIAERERSMRPVGTPHAPAPKRRGTTPASNGAAHKGCTAADLVSAMRKE